jgi:RNA polymerase primary sigma factor
MSDSIKDYLNSIAKYPLLTPEQEIQLGRRVARLKELQQLERPLTKDEQREVRSGERARQRFIHSNLQLVVHIARKYDKRQNRTLEFMDLIQEGNIGLSRAVDLFDPTRGYKFSTYAYWWIRQGITRALISYDAIIRLPIGVHEMLYKVNRTIQDLGHELGQAPSTNQVAEHLDMDPKDLSMLLRQSYRVTSLDQYIADSESNTIAETIADPASNQEDVAIRQDIQNVMECFAKYLDETTQTVLKARMIHQPITWSELERTTGINKTRLHTIEQRGIMRLRMLMSNPLAGTPLGTND